MTPEEFVRRIEISVYQSTVDGVQQILEQPPGRRPSPGLVALSQGFNQLSTDDKECVREIIGLAVRDALFGMFAVLDGVRSIREDGESLGELELRYVVDGRSFRINDTKGEFLHDLFAMRVPPP
jgi:hypothetical protein